MVQIALCAPGHGELTWKIPLHEGAENCVVQGALDTLRSSGRLLCWIDGPISPRDIWVKKPGEKITQSIILFGTTKPNIL
jgi:hypothetical protein